MIWITWMDTVCKLRPAFSRQKSFLWFIVSLLGFSTRVDKLGISSIIRALGMGNLSYECLRQFYRSSSTDLGKLTLLWGQAVNTILKANFTLYNGKKIYLVDGIKAPKEGRRMAGVKWLFQGSQNNSKPKYIFGHSCQALHALVNIGNNFIALPLIMRIHEGLGNRRGSVVMRVLDLVISLKIRDSYIVGDAYYWAGELSKEMRSLKNHLVSRVKSTAVAYMPATPKKGAVGRPQKYGDKKKLKHFFRGGGFINAIIELYGKGEEIFYKEKTLLCKNHQCLIKYVFVKFGDKNCIFASTDTDLDALEIIELYSRRFKIEFSFKEFVHDFGGFSYRFWSKSIERTQKKDAIKRCKRIEDAYHIHLQCAVIAQGLCSILAIKHSKEIWDINSSWMRTIRPNLIPSAAIVRIALREGLQNLNQLPKSWSNVIKFIHNRRVIDEREQFSMAA